MEAVTFFIGLILVGFGGLMAVKFYRNIVFKQKTRDWSSTTATIIESRIKKKSDEYRSVFMIKLVYEYEIKREMFQGRGKVKERHGRGNKKKEIKEKYSSGNIVTIFYNPDDVEESVPQTGARVNDYVSLSIPLILILIGLTIMFI